MTKLALLGGGGFRVPLVHGALVAASEGTGIDEVVLYDLDQDRLAVIAGVLAAADGAGRLRVTTTTDLDEALRGAAFVFSAIRVGGVRGRTRDERLPLAEGMLGQETTGPGGVLYGLRTVPVVTAIAERIARLCPDAWVVNFTNPAGMVTEAMSHVLGDRVIGICDSPIALGRRVARALGVPPDDGALRYAGLNHLGWLHGYVVDGRDRLPDLLADDDRLLAFEEGKLFGPTWLRALGVIPNEYLFYYYAEAEAVAALLAARRTRGEQLVEQQERFYAAAAAAGIEGAGAPERVRELWEATRREREATYMAEERGAGEERDPADLESGGYEGVAVAVMRALATGAPAQLILNVRNRGALAGLDADAVVEVPCLVDASGPRPFAAGPLPGHALGLVQAVKAVERDVVAAARTGDRALALRALGTHPLTRSVAAAERVLQEAWDR